MKNDKDKQLKDVQWMIKRAALYELRQEEKKWERRYPGRKEERYYQSLPFPFNLFDDLIKKMLKAIEWKVRRIVNNRLK